VGPRVGLDTVTKRKKSLLLPGSELSRPICSLVITLSELALPSLLTSTVIRIVKVKRVNFSLILYIQLRIFEVLISVINILIL
jgi:hypothetical protein